MDPKSTGYLALIAQRESLDAQIIAARKAEREVVDVHAELTHLRL
ncbi:MULTISPECIES: hypothetical protein [Burkholderia]|nr:MULTISPECIES: hypothetical protein [Burkholderia]